MSSFSVKKWKKSLDFKRGNTVEYILFDLYFIEIW